MTPEERAEAAWVQIIEDNPYDPAEGIDPRGALAIIATAIREAVAEAYEECARIAEQEAPLLYVSTEPSPLTPFGEGKQDCAMAIAKAIRERGKA